MVGRQNLNSKLEQDQIGFPAAQVGMGSPERVIKVEVDGPFCPTGFERVAWTVQPEMGDQRITKRGSRDGGRKQKVIFCIEQRLSARRKAGGSSGWSPDLAGSLPHWSRARLLRYEGATSVMRAPSPICRTGASKRRRGQFAWAGGDEFGEHE